MQETKKWKEALPIGVPFFSGSKIIDFYLTPKNMGKSLFPRLINELDLYEHNPMSLQGRYIYIYKFIFRNKRTNCILSFNKIQIAAMIMGLGIITFSPNYEYKKKKL